MIFGIRKIDNFEPYNVFLAIATNIPVQQDWFCGPGSQLKQIWSKITYHISSNCIHHDKSHLFLEGNSYKLKQKRKILMNRKWKKKKSLTSWDANEIGSVVLVGAITWIFWCKSLSV